MKNTSRNSYFTFLLSLAGRVADVAGVDLNSKAGLFMVVSLSGFPISVYR